uniref:Pirin n=1 Tax=Macrostomum lignano TaxID=282301 RepID=A0A1I8F379_9PLAT
KLSASSARCRAACPRNLPGIEQDEGVGARVRRSIGRPEVARLDPFLLLDEFRGSAPAGFPDHPHRGFETVTYVLEGAVRHEDFLGNQGVIRPGDLQWMTAGRGIVHCEMPHGEVECRGLQLWVNLPRTDKMCEPAYQDLRSSDIPSRSQGGVTVRVIAGESLGAKSPVFTRTPTLYLDVTVQPGVHAAGAAGLERIHIRAERPGRVRQQRAGASSARRTRPCCWTAPARLCGWPPVTGAAAACRFVLIAGRPLGEPVEQWGPFVMCSKAELLQAKEDYRNGRNGFERAPGWASF